MELNGLPLHALVVHAAVVFGPLSALAGVLYAVPKWRDKLRWPLVVTVAIALGTIWVAYLSGQQVKEANQFGGDLAKLVKTHEDRAGTLRLLVSGFAVASFVAAWQHARTGPLRTLLAVLVAVLAVLTGIWVGLTGDAGAQIAWFGING
jgi:ABC-type Mn2+/Zn2+ transport system permease subunit